MPAGAWAGPPFLAQAQTYVDNGRHPDDADRAAIAGQEAVVVLLRGRCRNRNEPGDVANFSSSLAQMHCA